MSTRIDISAPIIANESLGGLRLRTHIIELAELITGLGVSRPGGFDLLTPFEARYSFAEGSVQAVVDVRNGKVFRLHATKNYNGSFGKGVRVGMRVQEAMLIEPRLYYSEVEELLLCEGVPGITFDIPVTDPEPADVPSLAICVISVYAQEIETADGQAGRW